MDDGIGSYFNISPFSFQSYLATGCIFSCGFLSLMLLAWCYFVHQCVSASCQETSLFGPLTIEAVNLRLRPGEIEARSIYNIPGAATSLISQPSYLYPISLRSFTPLWTTTLTSHTIRKMEQPAQQHDGSERPTPVWVPIVLGAQFFLAIIVLGLSFYIIHGYYFNSLGFAIFVVGSFTKFLMASILTRLVESVDMACRRVQVPHSLRRVAQAIPTPICKSGYQRRYARLLVVSHGGRCRASCIIQICCHCRRLLQ